MEYFLKDNEGFNIIKGDETIDIYQSIEDLKNAIDIIYDSLANLAFIGDKPNLPWHDNTNQYIQDGLVFHLDGINKGGVDNQWTDLIGGVDFPNHGATEGDDCWIFDGVDDWLGYVGKQYDLGFDNTLCTIECAYYKNEIGQAPGETDAGFSVCSFGTVTAQNHKTIGLQFASSYSQKYINHMHVGSTNNVWVDNKIDTVNAHTVSVNKERAFDNELQCGSLGTTHWTTNSGGRLIGATNGSGTVKYFAPAGKIFAIRIYNRILTEAEMRHNQNIDNIRFNLGLTIPN